MYAQVDKLKENRGRTAADPIIQKRNNQIRGYRFVNERPQTVVQRKLEVGGKRFDKSLTTEELKKIIPQRSKQEAVIATINKALGLEYEYRFERWIDVVHAAERQSDPSKWLSDKNVNKLLLHTLKTEPTGKPEGHKKGERWEITHDRHGLISPLESPEEWGNSIKKGRVSDLFLTLPGLKGHAQQIDGEIKRAKKLIEGANSNVQSRIVKQLDDIKHALIAAAKDAKFDFDEIKFDFYQPLRMKMENRKLFIS